jgi:hypothetical protein
MVRGREYVSVREERRVKTKRESVRDKRERSTISLAVAV